MYQCNQESVKNKTIGIVFNYACGMETLGKRIKALRTAAGLTQVELAKALGLKQQTLSHIENDKGEGSRHIVAIAMALGVNPEWLEFGTGVKDQPSMNLMIDTGDIDQASRKEIERLVAGVRRGLVAPATLKATVDLVLISYNAHA